jgi:hypothetical protein
LNRRLDGPQRWSERFGKREKSFFTTGIRSPGLSTRGLVAATIALLWLKTMQTENMFYDSTIFLGGLFKKIVVNDTVFDLGPYYIVLNYLYLKKGYELILYYLYKICYCLSFPDEV